MAKKRSFKTQDGVLEVPENELTGFMEAFPEAQEVETYVVGKDIVDVPLNEVSDFLKTVPDAKKKSQQESTQSPSSVGKSVSQNAGIDIGEQLKKATSGPQDFIAPEGFTIGQQGKVIPAQQEKSIKFAGAQKQAQNTIKEKSQALKKSQFDLEADEFNLQMLDTQAKKAAEAGNEQAYNNISQTYQDIADRYNQTAQQANADAQEYNQAVNANQKIQNYFETTAKLNDLKKEKEIDPITGAMNYIDKSAVGELAQQVYNGTVPVLVAGSGIFTKQIGAALDELKGDPSDSDTLGDILMTIGQGIYDKSKEFNVEVSDKANTSVFDDGKWSDPRAWANTMMSGLSSAIAMGGGQMVGIPMWVTATAMANGQLYDAATEAGIESEKDKLMFAAVLAPIIGKMDELASNPYMKGFIKNILGKSLKETIEQLPKQALTPQMITEAFGSTLKQRGVSLAKEVGGEMLTGAAEETAQIIGETIYDATAGEGKAKGKGAFGQDMSDLGKYAINAYDRIKKSGVEEGVGALIPIGISGGNVSPAKVKLAQDIFDARRDPSKMDQWYNMIDVATEDGTITPQQKELYTKQLQRIGAIDARIPATVTNPEARAQSVEIIQELEEKRAEAEQSDPAFKPLIESEIKEAEARLQEIAKTNAPIIEEVPPTPEQGVAAPSETTEGVQPQEVPSDISEKGIPMSNTMDVEKFWSDGYEMYVASEQDEAFVPITSKEQLDNAKLSPELVYAYPKQEETQNTKENEKPRVQRLSEEEEAGRDRGGEINAESTVLTEGVPGTITEKQGVNQDEINAPEFEPEQVTEEEKNQYKNPEVKKKEVGNKKYKENTSNHIKGRERTITIADGTKIKGRYKVVSADEISASHNEQTFAKTEGFPVNEQGKTVNDRDYESDKAAQGEVVRIAQNLDSRAVTQTPIVTKDGIVVDGNNRTMSRKLAAKQGTDAEYIEALKNDADMYGIDPEQIDAVKNPTLVFEAEQDIPYTTKEFARFNKQEKKEKSPIEKAVELSKTISDRSRRILSKIYDEASSPSDVTSNRSLMNQIKDLLLSEGIIQTNELPRYINPETGTATKEGVAFLETLLIGSSLDENTIRLLNQDGMGDARKRVLESVVQITQNAALGENSLQKNIEAGVKLLHKANSSKQTVLEAVSQMDMFEVSEFSAEDIAVAILLDGSGFKVFLKQYNSEVGTESIFDGTITKEKIIDNLLSQKVKNYEQIRKNLRPDAQARPGEVQEGDGGNIEEKGPSSADEIAKRIRRKKTGGAKVAFDFGITVSIYNGALEFMAKQVENGTKIGNAIAKTIKWIDEKMEGKKWDKGAFAKYMNDQYKVKLGDGKVVEVVRDDTKETAEVINGFYLPIEQKILDTKQESLPANKWAEILRSKEDEDLYTGVREYLESRGTSQVAKKELKDFIKNNRIEIVEVVKGGLKSKGMTAREAQEKLDEGYEVFFMDEYGGSEFQVYEIDDLNDNSRSYFLDSDFEGAGEPTKYHQYQLPGEKENYKEVLITLPHQGVRPIGKWEFYEREGYTEEEFNQAPKEFQRKLFDKWKAETSLVVVNKKHQFNSTHFDEPNILVHLRMNTRKDAEGNKILFLEEVQSDWGQKGKKEGFDDKSLEVKRNALLDEMRLLERKQNDNIVTKKISNTGSITDFQVSYKDDNLNKELDEKINNIRNQVEEINRKTGITPAAPFVTDTNSWVRLGLKYAIKQAVEQGADKLAWTTGEQQNERYDLSKQVDFIDVFTNDDGTYWIEAVKGNETISKEKSLKAEQLEGLLGKDLSSKIIEDTKTHKHIPGEENLVKTYRGKDLSVGGKGMKGFYGSIQEGKTGILGGVVESLTGQKIGEVSIGEGEIFSIKKNRSYGYDVFSNKEGFMSNFDTENQAKEYAERMSEDYGSKRTVQPSIDITPEIKQYVEEGMPLFKGKEVQKPTQINVKQEGQALEDYFESVKKAESSRSNIAKEEHIKRIEEIEATMPEDFLKKAKFVKENIAQIREAMEKKGILKVEC